MSFVLIFNGYLQGNVNTIMFFIVTWIYEFQLNHYDFPNF